VETELLIPALVLVAVVKVLVLEALVALEL
jgi:hypothetical protein